jgi:hypothetical protein
MNKIAVVFEMPGGTAQQYDAVWDILRKQGLDHPKGLIHHIGAPTKNGWMVVDTWESEAAFNEFTKVLMPAIAQTGFPKSEPKILPIHYEYNAADQYA